MLEYILDSGTVVPSYHCSLIIFLLLLSFLPSRRVDILNRRFENRVCLEKLSCWVSALLPAEKYYNVNLSIILRDISYTSRSNLRRIYDEK